MSSLLVLLTVVVAGGRCSLPHAPSLAGQWAVGLRDDEGAVSQGELEQRAQYIAQQHGLDYRGPVRQ